jgi:hypothetical protein
VLLRVLELFPALTNPEYFRKKLLSSGTSVQSSRVNPICTWIFLCENYRASHPSLTSEIRPFNFHYPIFFFLIRFIPLLHNNKKRVIYTSKMLPLFPFNKISYWKIVRSIIPAQYTMSYIDEVHVANGCWTGAYAVLFSKNTIFTFKLPNTLDSMKTILY